MAVNTWLGTTSTDPTVTTNWSTGAVPTSGDTVYVDQNAVNSLASSGSNQSAIVLAALYVNSAFWSKGYTIGAVTAPWQIGTAAAFIGIASPGLQITGAQSRVNIDFGTGAMTCTITSTPGGSIDPYLAPMRIKGVNSANVLVVQSGTVGVATNTNTEVATFGTINVVNGNVTLSPGVTWTTINQSGGNVVCNTGGTTLTQTGGTITTGGIAAAITTATIGGTAYLNHRPASGAMITTLNVLAGGNAHFEQNPTAGTMTTKQLYIGATVRLPTANPTAITYTNEDVFLGGASTIQVS